MEKDLEELKDEITRIVEKYQLKTFKINTKIEHHSRFNSENSNKWVLENYSTVNKIDINLTK